MGFNRLGLGFRFGSGAARTCTLLLATAALAAAGCRTQTEEGYFRKSVLTESFALVSSTVQVNQVQAEVPKIDLLWVIDNSLSMEDKQDELTAAFDGFSAKYLRDAGRDLRIAAITTDTYRVGQTLNYYNQRGQVAGSVTYPTVYANLLPGCHDGERPGCGGTVARSGKPILMSLPGPGVSADGAWFNQLVSDFALNAHPGINGDSDESAMASIKAFVAKNENSGTCMENPGTGSCFFRRGSKRIILPFSDSADVCDPLVSTAYCDHSSTRVAALRSALEALFERLDGDNHHNYFVKAIRATSDDVSSYGTEKVDYDQFVSAVKSGDVTNPLAGYSQAVSLTDSLANVLDDLGGTIQNISNTVTTYQATIHLQYAPDTTEYLKLYLQHSDGSRIEIAATDYTVSGTEITLKDALVRTMIADDRVVVEYIRVYGGSSG